MFTQANYLAKANTIDFSTLPPVLGETHQTLLDVSDNGRDWGVFKSDASMGEILDLYLSKLNQAVGKKPNLAIAKSIQKGRSMSRVKKVTSRAATTTLAARRQATRIQTPPAPAKPKTSLATGQKATTRQKVRSQKASASVSRTSEAIFVDTTNNVVLVQSQASVGKAGNAKSAKRTPAVVAGKKAKTKGATSPATPATMQRVLPSGKRKGSISLAELKKERARLKAERIAIAQTEAVKNLTAKQVIEIGKRLNHQRYASLLQVDTDSPTINKQRLAPTPANLLKWAQKPGRYDLIGVDAAGQTDVTVYKKRDAGKVPSFLREGDR